MIKAHNKTRLFLSVCTFTSLIFIANTSFAQNAPIVYPSQGQSYQEQSQDEQQCRSWAQQQTGFNPYQPQSTGSAPQQGGGEIIGGAVRGTVLGAIGGAIGDDTGEGAKIGAGVGAAAGLMRKNRNRKSYNQAQQHSVSQHNQQLATFNRAFSTCMLGRGYTVN